MNDPIDLFDHYINMSGFIHMRSKVRAKLTSTVAKTAIDLMLQLKGNPNPEKSRHGNSIYVHFTVKVESFSTSLTDKAFSVFDQKTVVMLPYIVIVVGGDSSSSSSLTSNSKIVST